MSSLAGGGVSAGIDGADGTSGSITANADTAEVPTYTIIQADGLYLVRDITATRSRRINADLCTERRP
jgi:hypothetical protein